MKEEKEAGKAQGKGKRVVLVLGAGARVGVQDAPEPERRLSHAALLRPPVQKGLVLSSFS